MSKTITGLSLIIGALVIIIASFLIPGNSAGITGGDAISFSAMTENAGFEKGTTQTFIIILGFGCLIFLNGFMGIYRGIGDRETEFKGLAMALTVIAITLFMGTLALGNAFASSAETNITASQGAQMAAQAAAGGDPTAIAQANAAATIAVVAGSASAGIFGVYWGVYAMAGYVFLLATIFTGWIIIKSGNHYLNSILNMIVGYGLMISGIVFLILNLIWPVNEIAGYQIFGISQLIWGILIIILGTGILTSKAK
jgi:hypothetical protein